MFNEFLLFGEDTVGLGLAEREELDEVCTSLTDLEVRTILRQVA